MSARAAKMVEWAILGLCIASLAMIFQPFSPYLFAIGAGTVVLGGLAFNLVPLCRPGIPARRLLAVAAIVLCVFIAVVGIAIGAAELYALYLTQR